MRLINLVILLSFLIIFNVKGQQTFIVPNKKNNNLPNLAVGDSLPDFAITKLINTDKNTEKIADYKDKLLIIDFWSINCSGCVEALPKMDTLQKQFDLKIKILPVTFEKEADVIAFWKNNKYTKNLSLPSVVEDEMFTGYFKHLSIPHEVWIYKGKIIGITSSDYVDTNNIQLVLSGQQVNWPVKNDFYTFDGTKESIFASNQNKADAGSTFLKYVAISHYKENVSSEVGSTTYIIRDPQKQTVRAYFLNSSIYIAYLLNWARVINSEKLVKPSLAIYPNQIVWEVRNKSKYTFIDGVGYKQDWLKKNGICFESLNPDSGQTDVDVRKSVIADMDRLLNLHAHWEKRKEKILILERTKQKIQLKSKRNLTDKYDNHLILKGEVQQFRSITLSTFTMKMNQEPENPYVFDETGYTEKVDLDLNFSSWTDIAGINKSLKSYGLNLKEEERVVDKFVFTENN